MAVHPREEQETIIRRDFELDRWYYYSDVPADNKKWRSLVDASRCELDSSGHVTVLEGVITGTVILRNKPKKLTHDQRTEHLNRLKTARMQKL